MAFGNRIKDLRTSNNISQQELAEILDVKKSTISNYESNYSFPSFDMLIKISRYFHVSTDYLCGLSPYRTQEEASKFYYASITDKLEKYNSVAFKEAIEWAMNTLTRSLESNYTDTVELYESLFSEIYYIEFLAIALELKGKSISKEKLMDYLNDFNKKKSNINRLIDDIAIKSINHYLSESKTE